MTEVVSFHKGVSCSASDYVMIRKNLLFYEKRMELLLRTRVIDDFHSHLQERSESRDVCARDCRKSLQELCSEAAKVGLSGKWSTARISSMFGLKVPFDQVIGNEAFEEPRSRVEDLHVLLDEMNRLSQKIPEFREVSNRITNSNSLTTDAKEDSLGNEAKVLIDQFIKGASAIHWTSKDLRRIKESVQSKHTVVCELESLAAALQDSHCSSSVELSHLEELRRKEECALMDGEVATFETTVKDKISALERLVDILLFQIHTIESSVESNVKKRKSNTSVFVNGAAVIQCLIADKKDMIAQCEEDIVRIDRCLFFEEANHERGDMKQKIIISNEKLEAMDSKRVALTKRLEELFKDFSETELALEQLGNHRTQEIFNHLELLDTCRRVNTDYMEMRQFAESHKENLITTQKEYTEGIRYLEILEKVILQQKSFETYDFRASAKRLDIMLQRACVNLNQTFNDFEIQTQELVRRLEMKGKKLCEEIDHNNCEAELRRDTLDPMTKKYVDRNIELQAQLSVLGGEINKLNNHLYDQKKTCMSKIRLHLSEDEIVDSVKSNSDMKEYRQEELLDFRQEILNRPEISVVDERFRLAREKQCVLEAAQNDPARRSRVLAIRNNISRIKVGELQTSTNLSRSAKKFRQSKIDDTQVTAKLLPQTDTPEEPVTTSHNLGESSPLPLDLSLILASHDECSIIEPTETVRDNRGVEENNRDLRQRELMVNYSENEERLIYLSGVPRTIDGFRGTGLN